MREDIVALVEGFAQTLLAREAQLKCFYRYETQVEGWFKGELLHYLDSQKQAGLVHDFRREANVPELGRAKVDFALTTAGSSSEGTCWIELKHWHIGHQSGQDWQPRWYFQSPDQNDVGKLLKISSGEKYLMVLATKNAGRAKWNDGVSVFNERFAPLHVDSLTNPDDYPDFFFLGLLEAQRGEQ